MLYSSIFCRKSVRKYDMAPLPADELDGFVGYAAAIPPLSDDCPIELRCLTSKEVSGFVVKAPHYMLACADNSVFGIENAGYVLQHLSLHMTGKGIGSCYVGAARPHKQISLSLPAVILMAFGKPAEPLIRKDTSEFKRKELSDILEGPYFADLVEPVRYAPSAMNSQPWFFVDNNGALDVYRRRAGGLMASSMDRMNRVDMGIALCHLRLSAEKLGKSMTVTPCAGGGQRLSLIPVARASFE